VPDIDIRITDISKVFGAMRAVDGVSIDVRRGEFLTLLGPSGCGKTTTLNMIAGFATPTGGTIEIRGRSVNGLAAYERDTGMVFQSYALFPHMTVYDNVAFGLRMRRADAADVRERVGAMLERVQLTGLDDRYPRQLSGGQQQRVALARAMVMRPAVLLLDEPLSNLDLKLREAMRFELKSLQRDLGITSVYVTHDQDEALAMSDRIAVMNAGRIEQIGTPDDIYETPVSLFVATFIGATNLFRGVVRETDANSVSVELDPGGQVLRAHAADALDVGDAVTVSIRPEKCRLAKEAAVAENHLGARLDQVVVLGPDLQYRLVLENGQALAVRALNTDESLRPDPGDALVVELPAHRCLAFRDAPDATTSDANVPRAEGAT
jgi:spermidine/putrescine ABC transporter ATP-binding subunit